MITEFDLKKAFDQAVHSFLLEEIDRKSLAREIADVKVFDKGSKIVVEREGGPTVEIEPKMYTSKLLLSREYIRRSDFDMIRAFFETLATKMADQETKAIIEEMQTHAGTTIDAKGDILGGLIEAVRQLKKQGHDPDLVLIIHPEQYKKLVKTMEEDPKRAELLKNLLSKKG